MMHAQNRYVQCKAERGGNACPYQQCAGQPWSLRISYGAEITLILSGFSQGLPEEGQNPPDVIPGCEFRHYAAILVMHFRLRIKRVAQQTAMSMIKRDPGFIARRFNAEYKQGRLRRRDRLGQQGACDRLFVNRF